MLVLQSLAFICIALCGYHEYVRFQHAYEITDQQMLEHVRALQTSACVQETVRSVEYKGTVVDCNVLRIIVQRPVYQQAFVLWWHTGVWMDVWKRVVGNTAIVVFLLCVAMYVGKIKITETFRYRGIRAAQGPHETSREGRTNTSEKRLRNFDLH